MGGHTFYGCTGLKNIIVENNNSYSVEDDVLYNYDKTEILLYPAGKTGAFIVPDNVTKIGNNAFDGCMQLTSVTIGANVKVIAGYAFCGCSGLTSIIIPDSVTKIDYCAFEDCIGLTSLTIGANVNHIGNFAFSGCTSLKNIIIENNNSYSVEDGVLYNYDKTELLLYSANKAGAFTIPDSVTKIGHGAFYGCTGLTSVIIPDSVTEIIDYAFYGCTGLTSIIIPDSVTKIGEWAFSWCTGLTSATIGASMEYMGNGAFYKCTKLKTVYVERSVTDGGITEISNWGIFDYCDGLMVIYVPADSLAEYQAAWSQYFNIIKERS